MRENENHMTLWRPGGKYWRVECVFDDPDYKEVARRLRTAADNVESECKAAMEVMK